MLEPAAMALMLFSILIVANNNVEIFPLFRPTLLLL